MIAPLRSISPHLGHSPSPHPHMPSSSILFKLWWLLCLVRQSHILHLGPDWGAPPLESPLAREWCLQSLALRPAINSLGCMASLLGASGSKESLIHISRMQWVLIISDHLLLFLSLFITLAPKASPASWKGDIISSACQEPSLRPCLHSLYSGLEDHKSLFTYFLLILEREGERGSERSLCCSTYLFIQWVFLACALTRIEPSKLVYWDDLLTNWTNQLARALFF